jgi:hypothetical protein
MGTHACASLEEREAEKRRRLGEGLAISSRSVFGLREELDQGGCLWAPGKDERGDAWVPGGRGDQLVALAPDEEARARLQGMCDEADAEWERLSSQPGFDPDPELVAARRRFAYNRSYLRAWAGSAGLHGASGEGPPARLPALRLVQEAVQGLIAKGLLSFPAKRIRPDDAFLRQASSRHGRAGTLNHGEWEKALKGALFSAWSAELMLTLQRACFPGEQLARVSNSWAVIQAYYSLLHLVDALQVSVRLRPSSARPGSSHATTSDAFRLQWQLAEEGPPLLRGELLASPLRAWLASWRRPQEDAAYAFHLGREAIDLGPQAVSLLAPLDPLDATYVIRRCLEGAHHEAVKGIPQGQRASHRGMYTMIDYLHKFRLHRNYGETISLVRGALSSDDARVMQEDIIYVASASALLYEERIMALPHLAAGDPLRGRVLSWMEEWLEACAQGLDESLRIPLRERVALHRSDG